jgi:predicted ATPase
MIVSISSKAKDPGAEFSSVTGLSAPIKEESLNIIQGELAAVVELNFAFQRTISRLTEITSAGYYRDWLRVKQYIH